MNAPAKVAAAVDRTAIGDAMGIMNSFIKTTQTMPILAHVAIDADNSGLTITGSDLDKMVTIKVEAEVVTDFSATVLAGKLGEVARIAPSGAQLALSPTEEHLKVSAGRNNWSLFSLPRADFPIMTIEDLDHDFEIEGKAFAAFGKILSSHSSAPNPSACSTSKS